VGRIVHVWAHEFLSAAITDVAGRAGSIHNCGIAGRVTMQRSITVLTIVMLATGNQLDTDICLCMFAPLPAAFCLAK